jgi:hypothetical protein
MHLTIHRAHGTPGHRPGRIRPHWFCLYETVWLTPCGGRRTIGRVSSLFLVLGRGWLIALHR